MCSKGAVRAHSHKLPPSLPPIRNIRYSPSPAFEYLSVPSVTLELYIIEFSIILKCNFNFSLCFAPSPCK